MTREIKKKVRIKCAAYGPDTKAFKYHPKSCVLLAARAPLHVPCPPCSSQGPLITACTARLAARHGTQGSTPGLPLASQRSLRNIKDPSISPVVMSKGYICRSFQFFLFFSHIPVQLLLKRDRQNHASLLFLTSLPTLCHQQKLKLLSE